MSRSKVNFGLGSLFGLIAASVVGIGIIGMLGWMIFYHSCMKIWYCTSDNYELQFPAAVGHHAYSDHFRDKCIEKIESDSEVEYAFWGTPGVFTADEGDDYIYIAFKNGKTHKSKQRWQKIIDDMCRKHMNRYRPKIKESEK